MKFSIESAGGAASQVNIGGHRFVFDQPLSVGGQDSGPSPLDAMVATVGACAHYFAAAFLTARKHPVDGLIVTIEVEKAAEGPRRLARIDMQVHLPTSVPAEWMPRIEKAVLGCPVWGTLVDAPVLSMRMVATRIAAGE